MPGVFLFNVGEKLKAPTHVLAGRLGWRRALRLLREKNWVRRDALVKRELGFDEAYWHRAATLLRNVVVVHAARLVLADCGAAFSEPGREAFRNMAAAAGAKGLAAITDIAMRRLFAPEFQAQHPDLMRDRREAFLKTDPEVFHAACMALAGLDLRPQLPQVKNPVLVLVGEHDEATPPPMSRELAAGLPDARLKIVPGCAHVPQLQSPEVFLEAIGDFLPALYAAI